MRALIFLTVVLNLLISCGEKATKFGNQLEQKNTARNDFDVQTNIKYAEVFDIIIHDGYKQVIVLDPWEKLDTVGHYIVYPTGHPKPQITPDVDFVMPVPAKRVVALSSSHLGMIDLIGETDRLIGVTDGERIYNEQIYQKYAKGEIKNVGSAMNTDLELILASDPDLVIRTAFNDISNKDVRMVEAGLNLIYNIEWMESSLLGRAEWIKFIAVFLGQEARADSIFNKIEQDYFRAKQLAKDVDNKPTLLFSSNYKGTWYMPGGNSYMAKLAGDAGGDYFYKDEPSAGSQPLSFEVVLENLIDADIWITPRTGTMEQLLMMDDRYKLFKSFREKQVFNNDKRLNERGANDYWESGVARPDLLLKDIIAILHPELLPDYEISYYRNIAEEVNQHQ